MKVDEQRDLQERVYQAKFGEASPKTIFEISCGTSVTNIEAADHVTDEKQFKEEDLKISPSIAEEGAPLLDISIADQANKESFSYSIPPIAIFWNENCVKHEIRHHPEQPLRVKHMLKRLQEVYPSSCFRVASPISPENILRFHDKDMLDDFFHRCEDTEKRRGRGKSGLSMIDGDTVVMSETRQAALCAAGAVVDAVDAIYRPSSQAVKAAFCCVRPPGHHAERARSMGFCFLNNAAIGAKYAQQVYGVERVAVIDFDVHHGNGTEEGFLDDPTLFYGSTHEKDNFPGTGAEPKLKGELSMRDIDRRIVNRYLHAGLESKEEFRVKWREVIDEMILFKPNLMIISAGFDAHYADPLGNCALDELDYEWATDIVMEACGEIDQKRPPPVISVLEGGYDIEAIASSALVHVAALAKDRGPSKVDDILALRLKNMQL